MGFFTTSTHVRHRYYVYDALCKSETLFIRIENPCIYVVKNN